MLLDFIYINIYIALTLKIKSKDMLLWRNEDLWIHTELRKIRFCRTLGQFWGHFWGLSALVLPSSPGNQESNNYPHTYWSVGNFPSPWVFVNVLQIELSYWDWGKITLRCWLSPWEGVKVTLKCFLLPHLIWQLLSSPGTDQLLLIALWISQS